MASVQERIAKLGKIFAGLNIGNDNTGKQFIYIEVVFPNGWGVSNLVKEKFGVNVVKNDAGNGYYFWAPMEVGFDAIFDAIEFNMKANEEAQEKKNFLAEKMKELQKLVLEEDMSVLKTLEFKVKRKKTTAAKKKTGEAAVENEETNKEESKEVSTTHE